MNDFKECYQSAVKDMNMLGMKEFHIDASQCMDKSRHTRWVVRRVQKTAATAFSAVCILFLCGFGTVKAAEYIENVIKVKEWGFESADVATMARNGEDNSRAHIISEEIGLSAEESEDINVQVECELEEGGPDNLKKTKEVENAEIEETKDGIEEEILTEEIPVKNYSSWEEFEENEDIVFPQPSINIGEKTGTASVTVCGDWAMVRYDMDEKVIWVERTDYADTQGHTSSKVFPGGICNERQYTTAQGYTYTLVDSVKETEEEPLQIHGAVTVGTYEAYIDFMGYTETEAREIIESIDLSLYE